MDEAQAYAWTGQVIHGLGPAPEPHRLASLADRIAGAILEAYHLGLKASICQEELESEIEGLHRYLNSRIDAHERRCGELIEIVNGAMRLTSDAIDAANLSPLLTEEQYQALRGREITLQERARKAGIEQK